MSRISNNQERVEAFAQLNAPAFMAGIEYGAKLASKTYVYAPDLTEEELSAHLEIMEFSGLDEVQMKSVEAYCIGKAIGFEEAQRKHQSEVKS